MLGMNENGITGWILAGVASVVASLTSAVAFLYKSIQSNHTERLDDMQNQVKELREDQKRLDQLHEECLRDREGLRVEVTFLKKKLGESSNGA